MEGKRAKLMSVIVPLLAAMVPVAIYSYSRRFARHPVAGAVLAGFTMAAIAYVLLRLPLLQEPDALARAVLCGVLVTEALLFHSQGIPSMTSVALFLFLYFYSTEYGKVIR